MTNHRADVIWFAPARTRNRWVKAPARASSRGLALGLIGVLVAAGLGLVAIMGPQLGSALGAVGIDYGCAHPLDLYCIPTAP